MKTSNLVIDEYASKIVIRIFALMIEGKSCFQIARILRNNKILKPRAYHNSIKGTYEKNLWIKYSYDWSPLTD